jgi:hypothetical protein
MLERNALIGKPVGPVALDVAAAFWQSSLFARLSYAFLSVTTLALLVMTVVGGYGGFGK